MKNAKGIIIKTLSLANPEGGGTAVVFATAARGGLSNNAEDRAILWASGTHTTCSLPYPVRLPPGIGLYVTANIAGGGVLMTYDLED